MRTIKQKTQDLIAYARACAEICHIDEAKATAAFVKASSIFYEEMSQDVPTKKDTQK